jgi:hypothetical protein
MKKYSEKEFLNSFRKKIVEGSVLLAFLGPLSLIFLGTYISNIKKYNKHKNIIKNARKLDKENNVKSELEYYVEDHQLVEVKTIVKDLEGNVIKEFSSENK